MKRILTVVMLIGLTFILSGCEKKVEQQTLECTSQHFDQFILIVQEDRIMTISSDNGTFTRQDNLSDVEAFEVYWSTVMGTNNYFDIVELIKDEMEMDSAITCTISSEKVKEDEYPSSPDNSTVWSNSDKDAILVDALAIETAAKLYCAQTLCTDSQELTWDDLSPYIDGIDEEYYDFTNNGGIIAIKNGHYWTIDLEATGTGNLEFIEGEIPTDCDRSCVIEDTD